MLTMYKMLYMEIGSTMDKYFQKVYILRHCTLQVLYCNTLNKIKDC